MKEEFIIENGACHITKKACNRNSRHMLPVVDWLSDIPKTGQESDLVEVQFKNTRKGYYHNNLQLPLEKGSVVIVEANPGYDMGEVTLTGKLVEVQMQKAHINLERYEIRNILRIATAEDDQRAVEAHAKEQETMIKARQLAKSLGLEMKIGDVEYQGDGTKAIFYYIADGRVDFRQLIKVLAEVFHVRIEMKQIGARQEAGRIGGFGPCGRELCCSTWMKNFTSVGTAAARFQNLSLNPQKLAGQCAKLKCCMNYEVDQYMEAGRKLPHRDIVLNTQEGEWFFFKADILAGLVSYSSDKHLAANITTITAERAMDIIAQNKRGENPVALDKDTNKEKARPIDLATQEDLGRFDAQLASKKKKKKKKNKRNDNQGNAAKDTNNSNNNAPAQ